MRKAIKAMGNNRKKVERKLEAGGSVTVDFGKRCILVVEDEFLLAADIVREIQNHGGQVVGPAPTIEKGLELLKAEKPDACILNMKLGGETVYPLADALLEEGIPFIFASAEHPDSIPPKYEHVPLFGKPIRMVEAASALVKG